MKYVVWVRETDKATGIVIRDTMAREHDTKHEAERTAEMLRMAGFDARVEEE